ncbi:hypothetical protein FT663_02617 [Candidozyma haemuli var. vulneris]|uniref:Amino acid permease/ SLC12A domain-containing protein n=1 Tax=Candidozyma haemuli TaxID=45357 RepID=A0A2V1AZX6_9ASCO|nr:hypothetical protein CXQ85_002668 [[Candida] haemuloni]KAF3991744.1 hypothetical protein FT663_02617 [[Candida] haemuloni var. vulneris]KAF3992059.1 hypothetical protein FT662_01368 [[Candida] haemuloni var. vulneris]PVH22943.1 hypothetical protein CXQ85_002668 [[Candida] haemuloni]
MSYSSEDKKPQVATKVHRSSSRSSSIGVGEIHEFRSPIQAHGLSYQEARANLALVSDTGYKPELRRNFSTLALLGCGFGLTNSWCGISGSLVTGISSGGPMMIVYGILIITVISLCVAVSLSELASAMPNAGGQYYWTMRLAPRKYAPIASYMCGAYAWAGSVFTSASVTITLATAIVGTYYLGAGKTEAPPRWTVFITYEILNVLLVFFNLYEKPLPMISQSALYVSLISFVVITIVVLAKSSGHYQSASFVFAEFSNGTGWSSSGIAFIVGLINPNWSFSCLDAATHLAEETLSPETDIPKAIIGTVFIGFFTSFVYVISMFFSIRNLRDILESQTGVPILDIFHQALGSRGGAIVLVCFFLLTLVGCNIASHTWQARLGWSFARDNGLPGSRYWSKVAKTGVPVNAHLMSCGWCAVIGCIYMASTTAYNAVVIGCISFLLISYSIPILFMLRQGRSNIKHGPFWLGKLGLVCNVVVVCWTVFAVVFYSLPPEMPVSADNMNYVSAVIVGFTAYAFIYWFCRGKKHFKTIEQRAEHIPELTQIVSQEMMEAEFTDGHKV